MCVFGSSRKLGQTEFIFRVDRKIPCLTRNSFSGFILPSNDFHLRKIEERERETARRSHQKRVLSHPAPTPTPDRTVREREADHLNFDLDGTAVQAVPPSSPIASHHRSTPPSSPIHKHPRPTFPILKATFCLLGFVAVGHGFRSLEFTCHGSWLLLA